MGRFDFEIAKRSEGWQVALRETQSETEEFGVRSFVYRARRPFHLQGFHDPLSRDWAGVLRSKGFFWLATRLDKLGVWSQAGRVARLDVGGFGWAAILGEEWPDIAAIQASIIKVWHPELEDCRQEMVFIGMQMDEAQLRASLVDCLLTDEELKAGPYAWQLLSDPFPLGNVQRADYSHEA
jgi:G3E family GTPase